MQTIILVRHGYPIAWDQRLKVRGTEPHLRLDSALAAIGQAQAKRSADHVAALGAVSAVLSSPFRRCLETADAIAAATNSTVTSDWRLGEVLISDVLGSPFSPTAGMDPDWAERRAGAGKPSHPESDKTVAERVAKVVADLKARKPFAQRVAIVSHEIILKAICTAMTGRAAIVEWHPGALTILNRSTPADRVWRQSGGLATFAHLGADDRVEPQEVVDQNYRGLDHRS
jgi:broad specificity phosphatase PhoE